MDEKMNQNATGFNIIFCFFFAQTLLQINNTKCTVVGTFIILEFPNNCIKYSDILFHLKNELREYFLSHALPSHVLPFHILPSHVLYYRLSGGGGNGAGWRRWRRRRRGPAAHTRTSCSTPTTRWSWMTAPSCDANCVRTCTSVNSHKLKSY